MPLVFSSKTQPSYDVIVVGSGAAGGQTAYTCAMDGAKVLMLEAGRNYDPVRETPMFQTNGQAPLRGSGTAFRILRCYGRRRLAGAGRALHQRFKRSAAAVLGVAGSHDGRAHESLGPHFAPERTVRLQAPQPRWSS